MRYRQRDYPMFSACGLNCGLCPRYQMEGVSRCPGCAGERFEAKHPACGVLSCSRRRGVEYCFACGDYPCEKYDGADQADSFITHLHQLEDMRRACEWGMEAYRAELDEKMALLETLLARYNDGRRKSLFCLAVNLLPLDDVRRVVERLAGECAEQTLKERAAVAAGLLREMADQRGLVLKLRKG